MTIKKEGDLPFCACGCGDRVSKKDNKFIQGHNGCKTPWKSKSKPQLCECGCGNYTEPGNKFIKGHNNKGKIFTRTEEFKERLSKLKKQQFIDNPEMGKELSIRQIQYFVDHPEAREEASRKSTEQWSHQENRDNHHEILLKYNKDHPERGEEHSRWIIQYYKDHPEAIEEMSRIKIQFYKDHPENSKEHSRWFIQYHKDNPEKGKENSERLIQYHKDHPELRERLSAIKQGQNYEAGEWTGFVDNDRKHLIHKDQCIHLNPKFEGCNQHHIMSGVIINIPGNLHRSVWHRMSNGNNKERSMKEINKLAFKYLLGEL